MTTTAKPPLRSRLTSRKAELWLLRTVVYAGLISDALSGSRLAIGGLAAFVVFTAVTERLRQARGASTGVEALMAEWEASRRVPASNATDDTPSRPVMLVLCLIMASAAGLGVIGAYAVTGLVRGDDAPAARPASVERCIEGIRADPMAATDQTPGCIGLSEEDMIRAEVAAVTTP